MITIPGLAVQAAKLIAQTNSIYMAFNPLIQASQRSQWEHFTRHNNEWVEEALQVQANNPHFLGPILTNYTKSHIIWRNKGTEPQNVTGPFLPSWMGSPVIPYYYPYNWNALAYDAFANGLLYTMEHKQVVVTPVANHADPTDPIAVAQALVTSDWAAPYLEPGEDPNEPFSDMYYPVMDTIDDVVMDALYYFQQLGTRYCGLFSLLETLPQKHFTNPIQGTHSRRYQCLWKTTIYLPDRRTSPHISRTWRLAQIQVQQIRPQSFAFQFDRPRHWLHWSPHESRILSL